MSEVKVVYENARITFTLNGVEYSIVRGPTKVITVVTGRKITADEYEAAFRIASLAFGRMDENLVFSMEKINE